MFHLRFTPDDISGYTFDFLDNIASRYIVAYEDKDKHGQPAPPHYHILIDADYSKKSISNAVIENLKIPKSTRGKNNKYYALIPDWNDPGYIAKYYDIRRKKGFTEKQVMDYAIEGKAKYLKPLAESGVMKVEVVKKKTQSVDAIVSSEILVWWYEQTREPCKRDVIQKACDLYRSHGKGINVFKVRDIVHTLYYDVHSTRDAVIEKIFDLC